MGYEKQNSISKNHWQHSSVCCSTSVVYHHDLTDDWGLWLTAAAQHLKSISHHLSLAWGKKPPKFEEWFLLNVSLLNHCKVEKSKVQVILSRGLSIYVLTLWPWVYYLPCQSVSLFICKMVVIPIKKGCFKD